MVTGTLSHDPRILIRLLMLGLLLSGLWSFAALSAAVDELSDELYPEWSQDNPIVRENRQPGSRDWEAPVSPTVSAAYAAADLPSRDDVAFSPAESGGGLDAWTPPLISGYADRVSVAPGGTIRFYISTTAAYVDLVVLRMGWYGGEGGRTMHTAYALPGIAQPVPTPEPETGLVAANWQPSYTLDIPPDWPSGVYLVRLLAYDAPLANEPLDVGYILFVVRDDRQVADIVYKVAVNTYQAYNNWGGKSLYTFNSVGPPATKVSFDRPYSQWAGAGHFFDWDFPMIRWLEREGYNVTYITDVDAHEGTSYMTGRRVLLSVGHDEYWSKEMRDSWEAARDAGYALGFFSGNNVYWQVRFEPSADGVPNRVLVCYKDAARDPLFQRDNSRLTVLWRDPLVGRPENALLGGMSDGVIHIGEDYPYVVKAADHWIFAGTGAQPGQAWSRIVGYEYERVVDNGHTPPGLVILSESPVVDVTGRPSVSQSVYYRKGGMVFSAGTIDWAWALDDSRMPDRVDPRIQRVTHNILQAFLRGGPPTAAASSEVEPALWLIVSTAFLLVPLGIGSLWYSRRLTRAHAVSWAE
ncbi:MAG TPA: N,N-dimethylformamidase beta subunit family domain-containing protein [Chloroflexota bacterium]|nr:N,N-dimethylformamidase beta subunit family domain-containing protein [Chloroflexota bacterium]